MEPRRVFCFIAIFVSVAVFALGTPLPENNEDEVALQSQKIDCQRSDYRTYIKCLRRQKRHHGHGDSHGDTDSNCMEACLKKCDLDHNNCDKSCSHCMRKTKHKHQIITEYETDCSSTGTCSPTDTSSVTNITTKIDINNVINTCTPGTPGCPTGQPDGSKMNNTNCCPNCHPPVPCYPTSGVYNPSPFPWSHLTLVPQLTLGLGLGPSVGDCMYPSQWPCVQRPYPPHGNNPVDCSGCGHPLYQYRCDVSCYASHQTTNRRVINPHPPITCQSPHCVGGS